MRYFLIDSSFIFDNFGLFFENFLGRVSSEKGKGLRFFKNSLPGYSYKHFGKIRLLDQHDF